MATDFKQRRQEAEAYHRQGLERVASTPEPVGQKFPCGTLVRIADDLGSMMRYHESGTYAKVQYTYAHAYQGNNIDDYSLLIRREPSRWYGVAWYHEWQLEAVTDPETLAMLQKELKARNEAGE